MDEITQQTRVGAYVVCVREGSVLLSRFARSHRWTLPGGGLDHGERPEDAAVREVEEETGYRVTLGPLIGVDSARWDHGHNGRRVDMHALRILYTGEVVGASCATRWPAAPTAPSGCRWSRSGPATAPA